MLAYNQRMVIGYGNVCRPDVVAQIAIDNATPLTGWPVNNLKYEDAHLALKTGTPSGAPSIRLDLGSARSIGCVGLVNHNLTSNWTGFGLDYASAFTGPWSTMDTDASWALGNPDRNVLFRLSTPQSPRYVRLRFVRTGGSYPAFQLGMIFLGPLYEVGQNPFPDQGYVHTMDDPTEMMRAAGGALYILDGPSIYPESASITFKKIAAAQSTFLEQNMVGKVCGIVPPSGQETVLPSGEQHFFGRFGPLVRSDRSYAQGDHRFDATIAGRGIV